MDEKQNLKNWAFANNVKIKFFKSNNDQLIFKFTAANIDKFPLIQRDRHSNLIKPKIDNRPPLNNEDINRENNVLIVKNITYGQNDRDETIIDKNFIMFHLNILL